MYVKALPSWLQSNKPESKPPFVQLATVLSRPVIRSRRSIFPIPPVSASLGSNQLTAVAETNFGISGRLNVQRVTPGGLVISRSTNVLPTTSRRRL